MSGNEDDGYTEIDCRKSYPANGPVQEITIDGNAMRIKVVNLKRGDIVLLMCPVPLTEEHLRRYRTSFQKRYCPDGVKVAVWVAPIVWPALQQWVSFVVWLASSCWVANSTRLASTFWFSSYSWLAGLGWIAHAPWPARIQWVARCRWLALNSWVTRWLRLA